MDPDLAEALELRDELLLACREVLLTVGTRPASALVAHIDALLDLDDEASPGRGGYEHRRCMIISVKTSPPATTSPRPASPPRP